MMISILAMLPCNLSIVLHCSALFQFRNDFGAKHLVGSKVEVCPGSEHHIRPPSRTDLFVCANRYISIGRARWRTVRWRGRVRYQRPQSSWFLTWTPASGFLRCVSHPRAQPFARRLTRLFSAAAARRSLPDVQCVVPRRRHTPRHAHTARHPAQICSWAVAARRSDSTPLRTR